MATDKSALKSGYEHIGFTISREGKQALVAAAERRECSTSHLLRQLVKVYLKNTATPEAGAAQHVGVTTR